MIISLEKYISLYGTKDLLLLERKTWERFKSIYDNSFWTKKEFLHDLKDKFSLSKVILYNNKLVGFSIMYTFKENYAHISRVAIEIEIQNKGFGKKLLLNQIKELTELKYDFLSIDLIALNTTAKKVYSKIGFRELIGQELSDYVKLKNRSENEYLGKQPSHIALIKKIH